MEIKNKALEKLIKFGEKEGGFAIHPLCNWANSIELIKRRKTVKIVLELPISDVLSGNDIRELTSFDPSKEPTAPLVPMLIVLDGTKKAIN